MKNIYRSANNYLKVRDHKMKKMSIISCTITAVIIFLFPSVLHAQNTIDINIQGKEYITPTTTPKIPKELKDKGAAFAVRAGDMINLCNHDRFVSKPFSVSKENKFGGDLGVRELRPNDCLTLTANNSTNNPILFWLWDQIHPNQRIALVVLPANWPDEGTESSPRVVYKDHTKEFRIDDNYWSPPLYKGLVPDVINECEEGICGTWTREGATYKAVWGNGAKATLTILKFDENVVEINRTDVAASVSQNFYARYKGKVSGNQIVDGTVEFTQNGRTWKGTWTGSWKPMP